jgi:hypothetical protein
MTMTTPTGRAVPRRAFLSLAALLAPGALDRIAAATIASGPDPEPEPEPVREAVFRIDMGLYRFTAGPDGLSVKRAPRPEGLAHLPQPEPVGHRVYHASLLALDSGLAGAGELVWASDPSESCARCKWSCNAYHHKPWGDWRCYVGPIKSDYSGPPLTAEAPGFMGYY